MNAFEKGPDFPATSGPAWPLVRMIVGLVLLLWLTIAAVAFAIIWLVGLFR